MTRKAQRPRKANDASPPEHPDLDLFLASMAGALEPAAARAFASHTSRCASCHERLQAMTLLVEAAALGSLEPIPEDLRRDAEGIFSAWQAREPFSQTRVAQLSARKPKSPWGTLRMRVAPPSPGLSFAAGFRTVSTQPRYELEGGGYRIELECLPSGRLCTVRGRLIREREEAEPRPEVRLEFEGGSRLDPVLPGARGFFGPIAAPCARLRIVLATARRSYRSRWLDLT